MKREEFLQHFQFVIGTIIFGFYFGAIESMMAYWRFEWMASFLLVCCYFVLLVRQMERLHELFQIEKAILISIILLLGLLVLQSLFSLDPIRDIKAIFRYFFSLGAIFLSCGACILFPKRVLSILIKVAILFFGSVLFFYPYVIYSSHLNILDTFFSSNKLSFLLGAANEDASVLACFLPFVLIKLRGKTFLNIIFVLLFLIAMMYNGTRTMFFLSIVTILICNFLFSKNKFLIIFIYINILLVSIPSIFKYVPRIFEKEGIFQYPASILTGQYVGGTLSFRISNIWYPMIKHTIHNAFLIGFGTGSWPRIANEIRIGFFRDKTHFVIAAPHNLFVASFAEWGLIGFSILISQYLIFSYKIFNILRNSKILKEKEREVPLALFLSWITFLFWTLFANAISLVGSIVLVVLVLMMIAQEKCIKEVLLNIKQQKGSG